MRNPYQVIGDDVVVFFPGTKHADLVALFSLEDFTSLLNHKGSLCVKTDKSGQSYAIVSRPFNGTRRIHRALLNPPRELVVDHINGNGLDNRRSNLRVVRRITNHQNRSEVSRRSKSGFRGVYFSNGTWMAKIVVGGRTNYLGRFHDKHVARKAVLDFLTANNIPFYKSIGRILAA